MIMWLAAMTALGASSPVRWQHIKDATSKSKMIRDSASNLYFVSPNTTMTGRVLTVEKLNALGTVQWTKTYSQAGDLSTQFNVRAIVQNASHVYVLFQERGGSGEGAHQKSIVQGYRKSDGFATSIAFAVSQQWESIAVNDAQIAILERDTQVGEGAVLFGTFPNLVGAGRVVLGNVASIAEIQIDTEGFAYSAATNTNGTVLIAKTSAAGGVAFQTTLDAPAPRTNEQLRRLAVDTAAQRVYAMGTAEWSPTDRDVMMYVVNSSTGAQVGISGVRTTAQNDEVGDLTVIPNSGVYASGYTPLNNDTLISRRSLTGASIWGTVISGTAAGAGRSHAFDADGNPAIISPLAEAGQYKARIYTYDAATGTAIRDMLFQPGLTTTPLQMASDAAGNYYVNLDTAYNSRLIRVQRGTVSFAVNNITGGSEASGSVNVLTGAENNETWTLTSSNPSLVSVPPSVVFAGGSFSKSFLMTIGSPAVPTNVTISARSKGSIAQAVITVIPSVMQSLTISPNVVIGGVPTTGTATLTGHGLPAGTTVALSSNKPPVASVPASVVVPTGQSSATFPITTYGVNANQGVVITATTGAVSKTAFFAVNAPSLTSISVMPGTIKGGLPASLTLNINGIAPTGGFSIVLFSGAPGTVILPATGNIPAGTQTVNVNMPTTAVTASTNILIFATRSGIYKTATITVTP